MCMSKPQRVLSYENGKALVESQGKEKKMASPFPLKKGDYVLCQAGLVVKRIPEADARKMLKEWEELNGF
jgi:hydrogenase maturation factor